MFEDLISVIKNSNTVMIVSHINPDGDTCGSALAVYKALINLGKDVDVFCDSIFSKKLNYIPNFSVFNKNEPKSRYDLCISCDCADAARMGKYKDVFYKGKKTVCIDHHGTNPAFATINYIDEKAAATCEFLFEILIELDKSSKCLDLDIATSLYCGIITDSGNFVNSNTTKKTKEVALKIEQSFNVNTSGIVQHFINEISKEVFDLKNRVLPKTQFYDDNTIAIIYFSQEDFIATNTNKSDTDGIINDIKDIDSVRIAVAVTQMDKNSEFKVSLRSVPDCRVDRLACTFGGGGHPAAAGFSICDSYYAVIDKILKACRDYV